MDGKGSHHKWEPGAVSSSALTEGCPKERSSIRKSNLGKRGGGGRKQGKPLRKRKSVSNSIFSNSHHCNAPSSGDPARLRRSRWLALSPGRTALQLTIDSVGVLTPAPWAMNPVITASAQLQAALGRRITEQAR